MLEHVTVMPPDPGGPTSRGISSGFPADLLSRFAGRLRVLALLYAFVFFMAGIFPALLFPNDRARFLGSFAQWGPAVIGIVIALVVALAIRSGRFPASAVMNLGLLFEFVSSYAIAAAEFADPQSLEMHRGWLGLSWVAVWVVLFTVVVPTTPLRALVTALASVSSVPVIIGLMMATGFTSLRVEPALFFIGWYFRISSLRAWLTSVPAWSTSSVPRSSAPASWAVIAWRRSSVRVEWARSGGRGTGCWRDRRPSS